MNEFVAAALTSVAFMLGTVLGSVICDSIWEDNFESNVDQYLTCLENDMTHIFSGHEVLCK